MGEQVPGKINFDGGLDLSSTHYGNQAQPGTCRLLENFECSIAGGYKKINGFTKYGTAQPTGTTTEILGVFPYADGVVAIAGTGVFFSADGITWIQVNRDMYEAQTGTVAVTDGGSGYIDVGGSGTAFTTEFSVGEHCRIAGNIRQIASITNDTTMTLEEEISGGVAAGTAIFKNGTTTPSATTGTIVPRTSQGRTQFAWLEDDGEYGSIVFTDTTGNNNAGWFKITGSGAGRTYYYDDLDADFGAPLQPKHCCSFKQRVVLGDILTSGTRETGSIAWSTRYQNQRFDGASAGTAQVSDDVVGVFPFKDQLMIFCRTAIHKLVNIDDASTVAVIPFTNKTGCASSFSIQELAGDVLFLSYEGIRVLSATDQYGDASYGTVSSRIEPITSDLINTINTFNISSCVIHSKNQYRLYYTKSTFDDDEQLGIIGTLKRDSQGELSYQWSVTRGIALSIVTHATSESVSEGAQQERLYHGGFDGYVYAHDTGTSFNGGNIANRLELNEVDYGDIGIKKTLHYVNVFGRVYGTIDPVYLQLRFDYSSSKTMQPQSAYAASIDAGYSLYGSALYGTAKYSGTGVINSRINVSGSGYSNNFIFYSTGTGAAYKLDGLYVDTRMGAKH